MNMHDRVLLFAGVESIVEKKNQSVVAHRTLKPVIPSLVGRQTGEDQLSARIGGEKNKMRCRRVVTILVVFPSPFFSCLCRAMLPLPVSWGPFLFGLGRIGLGVGG